MATFGSSFEGEQRRTKADFRGCKRVMSKPFWHVKGACGRLVLGSKRPNNSFCLFFNMAVCGDSLVNWPTKIQCCLCKFCNSPYMLPPRRCHVSYWSTILHFVKILWFDVFSLNEVQSLHNIWNLIVFVHSTQWRRSHLYQSLFVKNQLFICMFLRTAYSWRIFDVYASYDVNDFK